MPCSWGVKAGMVRVWVAGKTVWSPCYTRAISERFRDKELIIKRYINSPSLLYLYTTLSLYSNYSSIKLALIPILTFWSWEEIQSHKEHIDLNFYLVDDRWTLYALCDFESLYLVDDKDGNSSSNNNNNNNASISTSQNNLSSAALTTVQLDSLSSWWKSADRRRYSFNDVISYHLFSRST